VALLHELLFSKEFCHRYRQRKEDFVRDRKLSFARLILFQLNLATKSLSVELTRFFRIVGDASVKDSCSKQAYSQARMKMSYEAYSELNEQFVKAYYSDGDFKKYKGIYRLIAIDGSRIQLPTTQPVIERFGYAHNGGKSVAMAMTSVSYDVLNDIVLQSVLSRYESSERLLAEEHITKLRELTPESKDIFLLDRGYPSVYLMLKMRVFGYNFVVRCNAEKFLKEVREFAASGGSDGIIEINLHEGERKSDERIQELVRRHTIHTLRLRIVSITLSGGTVEYLLTSLLDPQQWSRDDLSEVYHLRWNEETYFNFQKNVLEIENFSGKTPEAICQDYYARVLSANINSLLIQEAQTEVDQETQGSARRQYQSYRVNKTVATGILKDEIIAMLFAPKQSWLHKYHMLVETIKRHIIPKIPSRSFPRKVKITNKSFLKRRKAI